MATPLIAVADARARVLAATPRLGAERVALLDAVGRVLAEDVGASGDTPPFDCSAMDGYAVAAGPAGRRLEVAGESRAGAPAAIALAGERAVRISTGAVIPAGTEAVIRQEDVERADGAIVTRAPVRAGENIRRAGDDMRAGTRVLAAGTELGPAEIGVAAATGAASLRVACRPRVAVLCTGDELVEPGRPLAPGQIYNSNAPMLVALARGAGASADPAGRLPDEPAATGRALSEALERADVVVVSGGVSVGPHDHVKPALEALGVEEHFWRVALQPGKPTWFGTRGRTLVFGLPGNPVSAFVTFGLFAAPALAALQGRRPGDGARAGRLGTAVARNPDRDQAMRVRVEERGGETVVVPNGGQGSHIITSLVGAGALAVIPRGEGALGAGERVELLPLLGTRA